MTKSTPWEEFALYFWTTNNERHGSQADLHCLPKGLITLKAMAKWRSSRCARCSRTSIWHKNVNKISTS